MAKARISRPPSPYPRLVFHSIRALQAVASLIVLAIMSFAVHFLISDGFPVPWTFLVLLSVSAASVLALAVTAALHSTRTLRPRPAAYANGALPVLWLLGLALLSWNLAALLGGRCDLENFDHRAGVAVCRLFKALESFSVVATIATAAALVLDLHTQRAATRLGAYGRMAEPAHAQALGDAKKRDPAASTALDKPDTRRYSDRRTPSPLPPPPPFYGDEKVESREPSIDIAGYGQHQGPVPSYRAGPRPLRAQKFAYEAPSEQTRYDGAGARALDRDFGEG